MAAGSRTIGGSLRYETILKLASGGMATVYVGTVRGALGFRQLVAIKKPHAHLMENADFRRELLAEAQLASMIHHANVVDVRDVELDKETISLVMDYIEGASLGELLVAGGKGIAKMSPGVAVRIILDACAGLHAAHELTDDKGRFIGLVHRDISPQNILVGTDGVSRVTDFGVAKIARKRASTTEEGSLKGKLAYMAPEYLQGDTIDRRFDVFGMGVVLWEALVGQRLFRGEHEADTLQRVLSYVAPTISSVAPGVGSALDQVVAVAVEKKKEQRFQNVAAMAAALENSARAAGLVASHTEVAELVRKAVGADLEERRTLIRARLAQEPALASVGPSTPSPHQPPQTMPQQAPATLAQQIPSTLPAPVTSPLDGNTLRDGPAATLASPHVASQAAPATAVPSTAPMGSPGAARTLASGSPPPLLATAVSPTAPTMLSGPPAALPPAPVPPTTAQMAPVAPRIPAAASSAPNLAPSHPNLAASALTNASYTLDDVSARVPKKSAAPLLIALAAGALVIGGGAIGVVYNLHKTQLEATPPASTSAAISASPSPSASASALAPAPPSASASASAPASAAPSPTHHPHANTTTTATAHTTPTSTPTPTATPTATGGPPPNPYQ
jgi:serine/threonine-protein kinase